MLLPSIDLSLTSTCEMLRCSQYTVDSAYLQACRAVKFSCPLNFNITLYRVIVSWSILRFLLLSTLRILYLKCPWDQIFNIYSFFNFCVQCGYLTYLAKFQAITSIRSLLMGAVSFEISRPPLLCLVPEAYLRAWLRITGSDVKGSSRKLTWLISWRVLHWKQHHQRLLFMIKVVFRLIFCA